MNRNALLPAVLAAYAVSAYGSSTTAWEMNSYQDFIKGTFQGVSLSRDGRITLAPRLDTLFSSGQPAIWAVAAAPDGSLYVGTGHRGRLYCVKRDGTNEVVWTAAESEIFAVAVGRDGAVYAGTSPDGKVYRIRNGKADVFYTPENKYIWSLAVAGDGTVYVGTGDQGRIYRVTANGTGELYYETGQNHITALAFDQDGRLLAGSEPNGVLYRVSEKGKAFVLYDANLPEIRAIVPASDGAIYVAALGGSVGQRASAAASAASGSSTGSQVTAPTTTITVTDDGTSTQAGLELKPKTDASKPQTPTVTPITAPAQPTELMGVEKSAVFRINTDNTVETLWSSKEENAYDLLLTGNSLLISTDAQGRIYRLGLDRRVTLIAQTNEGEATRLLSTDAGLLAATGTMGKLYRLTDVTGGQGTYESPVHDAGSVARWGQLSWRADKPSGAQLIFRTRSGNSARPDKTWSEWSGPLGDPKGANISSPNARFIQWKTELTSGGTSPVLTSVSVAYLPQNTPPIVRSITVTTQLAAAATSQRQQTATPAQTGVYSITVTDTGEAGQTTSTGTSTQAVARGLVQQIQINWVAEDPDGDRLAYAVYFRAEEDNQWKLLRANYTETSLTIEGDAFADGKYFFRVVASDKLANAGNAAREGELVSSPVLFDNTPPRVVVSAPRRNGNRLEIDVDATDSASALRRAEYSLDAAAWVPMEPADGIIDGMSERFTVRIDNVGAGEHLVVFRVYDSSNNAGLAKVLVH